MHRYLFANASLSAKRFAIIVLAGALCALSAFGQTPQAASAPGTLAITGDITAALSLTTADLDKMPQESASVSDEDGTTAKYSGVLLRSILERAGAPSGKTLRGKAMAAYVLAKAHDGYEVVFTLAELDQAFANERVIVAYKRDGKPLFAYQGPFRIICPADKAGARSIRMLETIEVVKLRK